MESPKILFVGDNFPTLKELSEKIAAGEVLLQAHRGSSKETLDGEVVEKLIEIPRCPGKSVAAQKAFEELVTFSKTVAMSHEEAETILKIMEDDVKQEAYYRPKPKAWTPGQTAPMRRGRK